MLAGLVSGEASPPGWQMTAFLWWAVLIRWTPDPGAGGMQGQAGCRARPAGSTVAMWLLLVHRCIVKWLDGSMSAESAVVLSLSSDCGSFLTLLCHQPLGLTTQLHGSHRHPEGAKGGTR